jgi:hypothetical protein
MPNCLSRQRLCSKSNISLLTAQEMEASHINSFSEGTEGHKGSIFGDAWRYQGDLSCEQRAVEAGIYKARYGTVSLLSAKSVLNRYAMAQPMDPIVRSSRGAFTAHLPLYRFQRFCLLSISTFRLVGLPESYHSESNKTRENTMALMACVRL